MLIKKSIALNGHRTSIALEAPFWDALTDFALTDGLTMPRLVESIDKDRLTQTPAPGLASALRVYVLLRAKRLSTR